MRFPDKAPQSFRTASLLSWYTVNRHKITRALVMFLRASLVYSLDGVGFLKKLPSCIAVNAIHDSNRTAAEVASPTLKATNLAHSGFSTTEFFTISQFNMGNQNQTWISIWTLWGYLAAWHVHRANSNLSGKTTHHVLDFYCFVDNFFIYCRMEIGSNGKNSCFTICCDCCYCISTLNRTKG